MTDNERRARPAGECGECDECGAGTEYYVSSLREEDHAVYAELLSEAGEVTRLRLTPRLWEKQCLSRGDTLSREKYEQLCRLSERCEAVTRALFILSDSMCSRRRLIMKLTSRGFSRESAEYAAALAVRRGYLDEASQAESIAQRQVTKCFRGRSRVVSELISKGYPSQTAREAANAVPQELYEEALERALAKKCKGGVPTDRAQREKLVAALCRAGFASSEVRRLLDEWERE